MQNDFPSLRLNAEAPIFVPKTRQQPFPFVAPFKPPLVPLPPLPSPQNPFPKKASPSS